MVRSVTPVLALLLALPVGAARAEAPAPAGNWKLMVTTQDEGAQAFWLLRFASKDGKWTGEVLAINSRLRGPGKGPLKDVKVKDGLLRFAMGKGPDKLRFEGRIPKEGNKLRGILHLGGRPAPVHLERTELDTLDRVALLEETLEKGEDPLDVIQAALILMGQAAESKAKVEQVRGWAARAIRAAREYGPTWQRLIMLRAVEVLAGQKGYEPVALQYARQAERMLEPGEHPRTRKEVLDALAMALEKAGKADEAKEVRGRAEKIDFSIKVKPFAGRKAKSDRVVLVELFTGAQCPPCVAADRAFDALAKTYKRSEVVLLQYHLDIPAPDPLTTPDSRARASFYGREVSGTPVLFVNGKKGAEGGGGEEEGLDRYADFLELIDPLLEKPAKAKLGLKVSRAGDKIDISAEVSELKEMGNDVRLRLVLVEKECAYKGRNLLGEHHHVVRSFPGGSDGLPLKEKQAKQSVSVDLAKVRKDLKEFQDKRAKEAPFFGKVPEIALKDLVVVAFVQNDETGEVLQSVQAEVP